ncbi:MAG: phosphoenolpyruvate carboxykinase (GTP) [Clostridia bacterium]|nr:phosphoenolpyruvate carboxykinase (GTP) [Clostridia bacterium]
MTKNSSVLKFIEDMKNVVNPKNIVWIDGSEKQLEELRKKACEKNEIIKLNEKKLPGCYLRRTNPNDVARTESRTLICTPTKEEAGPTNNWRDPKYAYEKVLNIAKNSYKNKTMYVIPYSMGIPGSKFAKIGIELTDSIYTVLNMALMTRVGKKVLDILGESTDWVRGLHATCDVDEEKRYVCHFPQDKTIISVNSEYGGNVLLGKKCFALRIASYMGKKENWLAEHMLILGIKRPGQETKYVCAAFPSACGKTNFAMLIPPEIYRKKGYKVWCVGDDISWLRIGKDGRLWAINPENGFFGVAPGTSMKSNPNALISTQKNTIFTNVAQNLDDNTVWWEGMDKNPPENALDWKGNPWNGKTSSEKGAHPNSRFTSPAKNCPCISPEFDNPEGVPISAIIFGGRRAHTTPLVYEALNWDHGVFIGSTLSSESTAASTGKTGILKHNPMAMMPFCGYNMGDYFSHWIKMGDLLGKNAPKIFNVNWFKTNEKGDFLWPGYGENIRVLDWILDRCENKIDAKSTPIGYMPNEKDINLEESGVSPKILSELLKIDTEAWLNETEKIKDFYSIFKEKLPQKLQEELKSLNYRLKNN